MRQSKKQQCNTQTHACSFVYPHAYAHLRQVSSPAFAHAADCGDTARKRASKRKNLMTYLRGPLESFTHGGAHYCSARACTGGASLISFSLIKHRRECYTRTYPHCDISRSRFAWASHPHESAKPGDLLFIYTFSYKRAPA